MPLTEKEYEELVELVCDIVNTSDPDQEYENSLCHKNLFKQLDWLCLKYGELPDLLSIRADHIELIGQRLELYERAIDLAENLEDYANITQSVESIIQIYIDEQPNYDNASRWFEKLESAVSKYGDEYITTSLSETKAQIMRLKISSAHWNQ